MAGPKINLLRLQKIINDSDRPQAQLQAARPKQERKTRKHSKWQHNSIAISHYRKCQPDGSQGTATDKHGYREANNNLRRIKPGK